MSIGPGLELRQGQRLTMTPQLRQAIRMLQMSAAELAAHVEAEIERNPLLERAEDAEAPAPLRRADPAPAAAPSAPASPTSPASPEAMAASPALEGLAAENLFDADRAAPRPGAGGAAAGEWDGPSAAERVAQPPSMLERLHAQIALSPAPAGVRMLAAALAGELDEDGYLRADPREVAARLGADPGAALDALRVLQACEPTGIGARDLAECLALQLEEEGALDEPMRALLAHLPLAARRDLKALSRLCGVAPEQVGRMLARLRRLDPRPGRVFDHAPLRLAPPDVFVRRDPAGGWAVELNSEALPRVLVNDVFAARVMAGGCEEARSYVAERRREGLWLVRSLEQRARSILKVSTAIVRLQARFFEEGVAALRPMTLRDVAQETGLHESTVSRVTAGKRLACARGAFDMRFFFSQALAAADGGEALAAEAVRARIRALIEAENPARPLSDDALTRLLRAEGVDVARRTVAKYREGMDIPSSVQRKRQNASLG
ncbi:RNA polymerase factor sigma-54 [Oceanicella actignis]|uniref:RNA polymerase factor sigma-54 n=1 Tax=Oceanicella actignis TaxID=1189325 RepID=UPI0011E706C8|nr:RNA polymerase factor sigma-54 [Oceanicella actignis]TYO88601.1 RNA polymerase RpoN-/SigL-like sigma 54 subunit [Oceanicella actignis]